MVFSKRRWVSIVWPVYAMILVIAFPITYAGALGLPPVLCLSKFVYIKVQIKVHLLLCLNIEQIDSDVVVPFSKRSTNLCAR